MDLFLADSFRSVHLQFSKISPEFFPVLAVASTGSCVGQQNKIGHPAQRHRQLLQVSVLSARLIYHHHHHHHHHHHYHLLFFNREGRWGTTDDFATIFSPFFSVFHCPLGSAELQACPFPDVVFPPLPLSALSSSPFHSALQDGFGQT